MTAWEGTWDLGLFSSPKIIVVELFWVVNSHSRIPASSLNVVVNKGKQTTSQPHQITMMATVTHNERRREKKLENRMPRQK